MDETALLPHHSPTVLHLLPDEIRLEILGNLDYRDLLRCRLVCSNFNTIIEGSSELQLILELGMDGMMATPGADHLTPSQKLTLLREKRRAWDTLSWRNIQSVRIAGGYLAYELVGGIFMNTFTGHDLLVSWLPSLASGGKQAFTESLGGRIRDFALDPTQDLIIYLADDLDAARGRYVNLNACTISSRKPHPDSLQPAFGCQFEETHEDITMALMQIAGDLVALFFVLGHQTRLLMWDWTSGSIVVDPPPKDLPWDISDFSFISSRGFCVTSTAGNGSIHVYAIDPLAKPSYIHIAQLCMPTTLLSRLHSMTIHTGPFLSGQRIDKPFTTSPESRLHVISMQYSTSGAHTNFVLFVHNRTFHSLIASYRNQGTMKPLVLLWSAWGPRQTRFLQQVYSFPWLRFVEGQRVVCPTSRRHPVIQVLDFNVIHPVRPANTTAEQDQDGEPGYARETITSPTHLPADIFEEEVITHLPYHLITRQMPGAYPGYMLDEDRIIALQVS
ncbi:hypothetical protein BD779DRAFT_1551441 [Infundibulicybe gibba]|nr:hypothetical protein BD779DRAFT_1551441 [Infundibulicybe gibba]